MRRKDVKIQIVQKYLNFLARPILLNNKQKIEDTDLSVKRGERILYDYQSDKGTDKRCIWRIAVHGSGQLL